MRRFVAIFIVLGSVAAAWKVGDVAADVVIKVRALNPLETEEKAVIKYALPKEIAQGDILGQKVVYSMERTDEEEPRKTQFGISLDEETGGYYIDDETVILPKEVVIIEVRVKDIWMIEKALIEDLQREVDDLLGIWEKRMEKSRETEPPKEGEGQDGGEPEGLQKDEMNETVLMMKEEILNGLDQITKRQDENRIIRVGVEKHMSVYDENIEDFRQVQQDIMTLADLIEFDAGDEEVQESEEEGSPEAEDSG